MAGRLTKKQKQILDFIEQFIDSAGYSPTYREIMAGLNYRSVATVAKHIDNLVAIGLLEKSDSAEARSVCLRKDDYSSEQIKQAAAIIIKKASRLQFHGFSEDAEILKRAAEIIQR